MATSIVRAGKQNQKFIAHRKNMSELHFTDFERKGARARGDSVMHWQLSDSNMNGIVTDHKY
jgi:hypothetical protein